MGKEGKCVVFDLPTCVVFTSRSASTVGPRLEPKYQHKSFKLLQFLLTLGHKVKRQYGFVMGYYHHFDWS